MTSKIWRPLSKDSADSETINNHPAYTQKAEEQFARKIPNHYKQLIDWNDPRDPLLLQVLPQKNELIEHADYLQDSVSDLSNNPDKGIIHKYKNRVLLISNGACAIHCRYCFRRHFPYSTNHASKSDWNAALNYISENPQIDEVILSGGDPLMLSTPILKSLSDRLESMDHIKTLRIHTRVPTVVPERINENLLQWLNQIQLQKVMVLHCNHANELSDCLRDKIQALKECNVLLLNQSVLLKGVNDTVSDLKQLSNKLFNLGVLPYYLNLLDKTSGTHHFNVEEKEAVTIYNELRKHLSGYLLPKLVKDTGSNDSKTAIF